MSHLLVALLQLWRTILWLLTVAHYLVAPNCGAPLCASSLTMVPLSVDPHYLFIWRTSLWILINQIISIICLALKEPSQAWSHKYQFVYICDVIVNC